MTAQQPRQPTQIKTDLHQFTAGALLPLLVALVTGALVFVAIYVSAWTFNVLDPHRWATTPAVLAMLLMWITRMRLWSTLAQWERWTGIDINNDGRIGEVEQAPAEDDAPRVSKVRIELSKVQEGRYSMTSFDLPRGVTEEHLAQIAHDMFILGRSFAETELSGTGKISLPKFRQLRAVMERQMLCEKIGTASNARFELTDDGEAWLRSYLPSPTDGGA